MEAMEGIMRGDVFQNSLVDDSEICTLYLKAGKKLLNFEEKSNADYLNRYYEIFKQYFNIIFGIRESLDHPDHIYHTECGSDLVKLLKNTLYYRIIYVLRNSPIISSAVAFHFQNILKQDSSYMRKLIKKEKIEICSVGGGAASDIVAAVKVLDSLAVKMDIQLDFRITIIESDVNWTTTCFTVLSCLRNFHGATWKIKFVEADISDEKSYSTKVIKSIQEADIVLMVMFLFDFKSTNLNEMQVMKNVSELMQCESMLFFLDYNFIEYVRPCFGLSGETDNLHIIYENLSDFHVMDMVSNYNINICYKKHFMSLICVGGIGVFVRAWLKTPPKEFADTMIELKHRFKKDINSCNPEQTFLEEFIFQSWLIKYAERKRKAGLSERSINRLLQEKKEKRVFFLNKLAECKEMIEKGRMKLVGVNVGENNGTHEINNEAWENYILQKDYSLFKKKAYDLFDKEILKL